MRGRGEPDPWFLQVSRKFKRRSDYYRRLLRNASNNHIMEALINNDEGKLTVLGGYPIPGNTNLLAKELRKKEKRKIPSRWPSC